jgi:hypothetical protein
MVAIIMNNIYIIIISFQISLISFAVNANELKIALVKSVKSKTINEIDWDEIRRNANFHPFWQKSDLEAETYFQIACSSSSIYLRIVCYENDIQKMSAKCKIPDGPLWTENSVEIFIAPSASEDKYVHFIINSLGTKYDGSNYSGKYSKKWDCNNFKDYVKLNKDFWEVLVEIPFLSVQSKAPLKGDVWRMNICRNRKTESISELSSWSRAIRGFHNIAGFGMLCFGDFQPDLVRNLSEVEIKIFKNRRFLLEYFKKKDHFPLPELKRRIDECEAALGRIHSLCSGRLTNLSKYGEAKLELKKIPKLYEETMVNVKLENLLK